MSYQLRCARELSKSSMSYRFGMISSIMYLVSGGGDGDYRQFSISVQPVRSLSFVEIQYAIKGFDKEFIIRKVYKVAVLDYVHLVKIGISVSCGLDYFHNGVVIQNGVVRKQMESRWWIWEGV
ncbi:hypothetical protein Tco_1560400 [Tanacetum coccineum]